LAAVTAVALAGCWGEPKQALAEQADQTQPPPKSMAEKRSLDPVSTPIYAGEDAKAKIAQAAIPQAIARFQQMEERNPASLQELVDKAYLPSLPKPPVGYEFKYDPATGQFEAALKPEPAPAE
jgi:hypothetical protein